MDTLCFWSALKKKPRKPFFVGIDGMIGSGKSTIAQRLHSSLEVSSLILPMDLFVRVERHEWGERVKRGAVDVREWYDLASLAHLLSELRNGRSIERAHLYDVGHGRLTATLRVDPAHVDVIVLEGLFSLSDAIAPLLDWRIFLDTDSETALSWAKKRDQRERNLTEEQWPVKRAVLHDSYLRYLPRHKANADEIHRNHR